MTSGDDAGAWRRWDLYAWSERLLEYYFGKASGAGPVSSLVVVGEELARAAGDSTADPDQIEDALMAKTIKGAGRDPFWRHAQMRRQMGPGGKPLISHLIVSCLIATELAEGDEKSYLAAFESHVGSAGDHRIMATLWEELAEWLAEQPEDYRRLALPDPGGWTRIGYSVKLAFPSKRDHREVRKQLEAAGLLEPDPPVRDVVAAVHRGERRLSQRFRDELYRFEAQLDSGARPQELRSTAFWSSVRAIADTGGSVAVGGGPALVVVAQDDGYDVEMSLGAHEPQLIEGVDFEPTSPDGGHRAFTATVAGDPGRAVELLLDSTGPLPGLAALALGGLIPFRESVAGDLESGERGDLGDATYFMVRDDLVEPLLDRFGRGREQRRSSGVAGWSWLSRLSVAPFTRDDVVSDALGDCRILQPGLAPSNLRVVGIRAEGGWLGLRDLAPKVRADERAVVTIQSEGVAIELEYDDGHFVLPREDHAGAFVVEARIDGERLRHQLTLVSAPTRSRFRKLTDPSGYVFEGLAASKRFADRWNEGPVPPITGTLHRFFLGASPGEFLPSANGAAFVIDAYGTASLVRSAAMEAPAAEAKYGSGAHRRFWTRLLKESAVEHLPDAQRSAVAKAAHTQRASLPKREVVVDAVPSMLSRGEAHPRLDDLMSALVATFNGRQSIDYRRLRDLIQDVLRLPFREVPAVIRAWQEAELIDEVASSRYSGRRFVGVRPYLAVHRTDFAETIAVQRGLTLRSAAAALAAAANEEGVAVAPIRSLSRFVPSGDAFWAADLGTVTRLAESYEFAVRAVPASAFVRHDSRDFGPLPPATDADHRAEDGRIDGLALTRCSRPRNPTRWEFGDSAGWSVFRSAAAYRAAIEASGVAPRTAPNAEFTLRDGLFLPLQAARWLGAIGAPRSGPAADGSYRYAAPTEQVREGFLRDLTEFNESSCGASQHPQH